MYQTWNRSSFFRQLNQDEQNLLCSFLRHAGVELYRQWGKDGKRIPLEKVIALSSELLCRGVNGFMRHCKGEE